MIDYHKFLQIEFLGQGAHTFLRFFDTYNQISL